MKVWPKSKDVRKFIKHPTARGFRAEGPADWPADVFTFRLLQDGDILTSEPTEGEGEPAGQEQPKSRRGSAPTS